MNRIAALVFAAVLAVPSLAAPQAAPRPAPATGDAKRGEYLVRIMGCDDCHTPWTMQEEGPAPDMTRRLSGHPESLVMPPPPALGHSPWVAVASGTNTAHAGPWGVSFTANLTPDVETGLGSWTEETFIRAIRTGRHEGQGRPILPPMPWPTYRFATDDDLKALFAFLRTLPPIRNRVPQPIDPPEGN